ncbi:MAG: response regulator [Gallionellaceae bacterium]
MDKQLAVYQHPVLTVLLDDSQNFLDSLTFQFDPLLSHKNFTNPQKAINFLRLAYQHAAIHDNEPIRVGYDEQADSLEQRLATINLDPIYRTVTNKQRFEIPAVLVIDYSMPQMSGIEFCEAIRELPCKKILLTGHADEGVAVDAFNRKLIDRFIGKGDRRALELLETGILELQREYFLTKTNTLKDLLSRHTYIFLTDPAVAALVSELSERYKFVEYYLFPNPDGVLFFDVDGNATLMVLATQQSFITQFEVAQDQGAPIELLAALQEFRLLPFFSDTGGMYLGEIGDDWLQYCLPPQICRGQQDYYWALFELPSHLLQGPVYSFAKYMHDQGLD